MVANFRMMMRPRQVTTMLSKHNDVQFDKQIVFKAGYKGWKKVETITHRDPNFPTPKEKKNEMDETN